jgi:mxaD protein
VPIRTAFVEGYERQFNDVDLQEKLSHEERLVKTIMTVACASLFLVSAPSWAAATPLAVTKTITINAPASQVWEKVKDFNGLNNWHPAVAKAEIVEGENNKVGAVRLLTLKDGGTIKEKLLAFNPSGQSFKYAILEGVLPVSAYTSTVTVKPAGKDKSTVTWSGHFKRKNTGAKPGDNENDKTALDTMSAVYQAGLDNLKKISETK